MFKDKLKKMFGNDETQGNNKRKIENLVNLMMKVLDTDSEDDDVMVLDEADRIRSLLIHEYEKVLGVEYRDAILKRIDYIVSEFKAKKSYVYDEMVEKQGKSR